MQGFLLTHTHAAVRQPLLYHCIAASNTSRASAIINYCSVIFML